MTTGVVLKRAGTKVTKGAEVLAKRIKALVADKVTSAVGKKIMKASQAAIKKATQMAPAGRLQRWQPRP